MLSTSISEIYGTAQYVPIDEKHPVNAQSPYAASIAGADQMTLCYYRSFGLPVKIVRPFNTYPRQSARAVIPTIITQLLTGKTEIRLGTTTTRDLTFVNYTVNGFLAIAAYKKRNGAVTNIGMKEEISIGDLANKIAELINADLSIITDDERIRPGKSEVERLMSDNSILLEQTDCKPEHNLDSGLKESIRFFEEDLAMYKTGIYNY